MRWQERKQSVEASKNEEMGNKFQCHVVIAPPVRRVHHGDIGLCRVARLMERA